MIRVTYCRKDHCLTVEGHALSGEPGHDLVCASASILTYTLATFVVNTVDIGFATDKVIKLESGDAEVSCKVKSEHDMTVALVFDSICAGFDILAQKYPENVKYEIINYTRDRKSKKD